MKLVLPSLPVGFALELHHLVVIPDDPQAWMQARLGGTMLGTSEHGTDLGWPVVVVQAVRDDGEPVLAAFYRFFHFIAGAVVRAPSPEALEAGAPALRALLLTGRPDFCGEPPVLLGELWQDGAGMLN